MIFLLIVSCVIAMRRRRNRMQYIRIAQPAYGTTVATSTTANYPQVYPYQQPQASAPAYTPQYTQVHISSSFFFSMLHEKLSCSENERNVTIRRTFIDYLPFRNHRLTSDWIIWTDHIGAGASSSSNVLLCSIGLS